MMRTTRLQSLQMAAALLCALSAGQALAQAATTPAAKAETPASTGGGFLPPASANAKVIDSIQVVVNDEVITRNEVAGRVAQVSQNMKARNAQMPDPATMERQVLEAMIVERAQLQLAKEMGVKVDDRTLDATIGRIAENQKMSVQDMRNQMEKEGMPFAQFREDIRNEIMMQRLREHEVDSKIQVSEAEIDTYMAAAKAAEADRIEVDISQILVRVPENASPEQIAARAARAEEVMRQLRTGADFARMASTYSDAPDALKGGEIGWRDADRLPPMFSTELRKLEAGQVTPILKTNVGFHILKLAGKRSLGGETEKSVVEQTHARHILIKVTPTMTEGEVKRKLLELKEKMDNNAGTFEDLARLHSQDGSASKGGDLGWLYPGDTVPEFETAMNGLKPGEVSDVIQSPFGFHLIQVIGRKSEDVTQQKERNVARQVLRDRKMQEAMEDWMRQVRDRAYVEFREEQ
ncbi:peptidyl-prolyl cis-trans isomerase SurA [Massilia sp. UYP32]|uniref:peptidylprolyl isomerase n=2 Tax=Massilia TaxID=149698 RepID=UPI000D99F73E|nr:peptidylprolyl isomerase [Massilia timonae]QYG00012.1 peptidylprolyl isomerase [Massilia sp. NP310]HAK91465.1 molecular chaperone SurA [Massilia timonae]